MTKHDDTALAHHFKAISHPRRARIFRLLCTRPEVARSFQSLQEASGLCESSLAHHLREMERCGLIRRRRRGVFVTFHLELRGFETAIDNALRLAQRVHEPINRAA